MIVAPTSGVQIALRPFKVGGLSFEPGDKYEPNQPDLSDQARGQLWRQGYHADFRPETYRLAMKSRAPGTIGRGFTLEFLYETGAVERPAATDDADDGEEVEQDAVVTGSVPDPTQPFPPNAKPLTRPVQAPPPAKKAKAAKKEKEAVPRTPKEPLVEQREPKPDDEEYNGFFIQRRKAGIALMFSIYSPTGGLLQSTEFRNIDKAKARIDEVLAIQKAA